MLCLGPKEFDITEARTHGPGRSIPMFKSRVWRPLGYPGAPLQIVKYKIEHIVHPSDAFNILALLQIS